MNEYKELNDKDWLYQKYWVEELSLEEIAEIVGCCQNTVRNALIRFNIQRRTRLGTRNGLSTTKEILEKLYLDSGYSAKKIANIYGVTPAAILHRMEQEDIPRRSLRDSQLLRQHGEIIEEPKIDGEMKQYIDGLLLSDFSISLNKNPYLYGSITHRHIDWAFHIFHTFDTFCFYPSIYSGKRDFQVATARFKTFADFRERWYKGGRKIIPNDIEISSSFVANWYLGDGQRKKDDSIVLHTNCFKKEEVDFVADRLIQKIGVGTWVREYDHKNQPGQYVVLIRSADAGIFIDYIKDFYTPSFHYKFQVGEHTRKKWLDYEINLLRQEYAKGEIDGLCKRLGRSESSIYHQANRLGLIAGGVI